MKTFIKPFAWAGSWIMYGIGNVFFAWYNMAVEDKEPEEFISWLFNKYQWCMLKSLDLGLPYPISNRWPWIATELYSTDECCGGCCEDEGNG